MDAPTTGVDYVGPRFDEVAFEVGLGELVAGWGVSWRDFDLDGDPDLFVSNHMHFSSALFRNEGGLFFTRMPGPAGGFGLDNHMGAWGDVDGDGDPDIFTTGGFHRPDRLFLNDGHGSFSSADGEFGLPSGTAGRGYSAAWGDLDGDRLLDLFVSNHLTPDFDYRRAGGGRFVNHAAQCGTASSFGCLGAGVEDIDGDADLDIYLPMVRSAQPNVLLLNRGDGTFVERSGEVGLGISGSSRACTFGDVDNDGGMDVFVSRLGGDVLLLNKDGAFVDHTEESGIETPTTAVRLRCAGFADFDNDTDLDLYVVLGGMKDGANTENLLFRNRGDGSFEEVARESGATALGSGNSSTVAFADYNLDGYVDLALVNGAGALEIAGPYHLLRNCGGDNRWLKIHARGAPGDSESYGARAWVRLPDGRRLMRSNSVNRMLAQDDSVVHFGLAAHAYAEEVRVRWIGGRVARLQGVPANEVVSLDEMRPHVIASHPAALLGEVPAFDLQRATRRMEVLLHGPLPPSDPSYVAERQSAVIAWAAARSIVDSVEVSEQEVESSWRQLAPSLSMEPRIWIEHLAIGVFTEAVEEPESELAAAERAAQWLREGRDVVEVARDLGLRAWATVIGKGDGKVIYDSIDETTRGYLARGWCPQTTLREVFGSHATKIEGLEPGEVLGPVLYKSGRDVQNPEKTWPVLHVVRVMQKEAFRPAVRGRFERDVRNTIWRSHCETAVSAAFEAASEEARSFGHYNGIRYPNRLPQDLELAVREGGSENLENALHRIEHEAKLDAAARVLRACIDVPSTEVLQLMRSMGDTGRRTARASGIRIFARSSDRLSEIAKRLHEGVPFRRVFAEASVPSIVERSARGRGAHYEECVLDESTWCRVAFDSDYSAILDLAPGEVSPIVETQGGYLVFLMAQLLPKDALSEEKRLRAAEALLRERTFDDAMVSVLGWTGPGSR